MNKIECIGQASLFERDYAAWALQQAAELRAGAWDRLDRATFPQTCPFTLAQVLDKSFLP